MKRMHSTLYKSQSYMHYLLTFTQYSVRVRYAAVSDKISGEGKMAKGHDLLL